MDFIKLLLSLAAVCFATFVKAENQPPTWNIASVNIFFQGVSEATPVGTKLADLQCIDPDGDPINYYLKSGKAVTVSYTGEVKLAVALDFEAKDTFGYDLTFTCVDVNSTTGYQLHIPVETRVQISVDDANDNPPKFEVDNKDGYSFSIPEDAPINTVLTPSIRIRDLDRTVNARIDKLYIICNSPFSNDLIGLPESSIATCVHFKIDYKQESEGLYIANLSLISPLDYESRPVYTTKLVAIDAPGVTPQFTTTVNVQINVQDAQDVPPVFTNAGASTSVSEGATIGSPLNFAISARDGDTGDKRPVVIEILNDSLSAFRLNSTVPSFIDGVYEAQLIVNNQLDRETLQGAYTFVTQVTELDKVTRNRTTATATATYTVFVTDVNDNAPTFGSPVYNINIAEINSVNTVSTIQLTELHITCTDIDEPSNARYNVTVISQTYPAFSVTPQITFIGNVSMYLKVDNPIYLDYDIPAYRRQTVVLLAKEVNTIEQFTGSTTVNINLLDINDNAPEFTLHTYNFSVPENVKSFNFSYIKATDIDSGSNSNITYRLEGESFYIPKFTIDSVTGLLSVNGDLDYESTQVYVFMVYATDQGNPPKSASAQVVVNILDFNDQGPVFDLPNYQTACNESSLVFQTPVIVHAVDNDVGSNVTYRIVSGQSPNNAFVLNPISGVLSLRDYLNFDDTPLDATGKRTSFFVLKIEASDNGVPPQTNQVEVIVNVIDENNHAPTMTVTQFTKTISEIAPSGTSIAQLSAIDLDGGDFGKVTYRLGPGQSDNFFVDPNSGLVTVNLNSAFDYDIAKSYSFIIYAADGGAPQRSATATVTVYITDANNKDPVFKDLIYVKEVDELTPVNTVILSVTATDQDSNNSLTYNVEANTIIAYDSNGNLLTTTSQYNYKNAFDVKANGDIYVKSTLNKNLAQNIQFTLNCRDLYTQKGIGTGNTQIALSITGRAENGIFCDPVNQIFINEDANINNSPITVTVRDPNNIPVNNYTKLSGSDYFFVEKLTGRIVLQKKLDYENDAMADHLHRIVVGAYLGNNSATCSVTISIVDINDNAPVFQNHNYEAFVSESSLYPTDIISIYATDADSKSYGPLRFTISGGVDSDYFSLFHEPVPSGALTNRRAHVIVAEGKRLDYNQRSQYDLTLLVGDNDDLLYSSIRLYDTATLKITVIDENNNWPTFKENSRSISVPETAELGLSIATLVATDEDHGRNGEITYEFVSSGSVDSLTGMQLFSLLPNTGTINVMRSLLGLGGKKYSMYVRACDGGDVPNCSQIPVDIYVLSTENDDGNPKWIYPSVGFVLYAPEETPNYVLNVNGNTKIFEVIPRHGNVTTYELSPLGPDAKSFKVNSTTGEITVVDRLDREKQETYNLLINAVDMFNGTAYKTGRQFYVTLTDIDDNEATFTNPKNYEGCLRIDRPLVISVRENTPANVSVYTLKACDPDGPGNNGILYRLYNGSSDYCYQQNNISDITVDSNGVLITRRIIDYEQNKEYNLCVEAVSAKPIQGRKKRSFDMSKVNSSLDNVAHLNIQIIDLNDNGPSFPKPNAFGAVETDPKAGPVLQLDAVDLDGPGNNEILYRIENSIFYPVDGSPKPVTGAFILRGDKKAIYPAYSNYGDYIGGHFEITVVASDPTNTSISSKQTVNIFIYDSKQALKMILNLPPADGFTKSHALVRQLAEVSSSYYFSYIQASGDSSSSDMTNVCFLVVKVDSEPKAILSLRDVEDLLDQNKFTDVWRLPVYKAVDRGQCFPSESSEKNVKWRDLWWVLVALAIFIFVCCVILIILVAILYDRYKSYMTTRKTYLVSQ
ncbi:cadherin-23 isoform X2 [Biomphalaria glabrata]|nr:cadherin-23 isoform X2 [Biomphalaria glabrata]